MPEKVHIASLGFNEQGRILYVLRKIGGSKVVIIHSKETEQDAKAISAEIRSKAPWDAKEVLVDAWDYYDVLHKTVNVCLEHYGKELCFNPSLGTRVMTTALFTVANFTSSNAYLVKEDGQGNSVDVIKIDPVQRQLLNTAKKRVLKTLDGAAEGGFATVGNLARAVGIRSGTTSDHVNDLEGWGYARTEPNGRRKRVYITPLGSAVLKMSKLWQKKNETREKK